MLRVLFLISFICIFNVLISQSTYFSKLYNPNNTYTSGLAIESIDNQYFIFGSTNDSVYYSRSVFLAIIDSIGNIKSYKTISDPDISFIGGLSGSFTKLSSGGFIAAGHMMVDYTRIPLLYRFNELGDTIWTRAYRDTISDLCGTFLGCNITNDNGYVMTGYTCVPGNDVIVLVVVTDSIGAELNRFEFGDAYDYTYETGIDIHQLSDNGYILGYINTYHTSQGEFSDPIVAKLDSIGEIEWEINLGGPYHDTEPQICLGYDQSIIVGTSIRESTNQGDIISRISISKISHSGTFIWQKKYCHYENDNTLSGIIQDHDGGYIATGYSGNLGWMLKISENGDSIWYREYQYYTLPPQNQNMLNNCCLSSDGGYAIVGNARIGIAAADMWLVKVDSFGCDTPGCQTIDIKEVLDHTDISLNIFPNPAINEILIDIKYQISNIRPFDKLRTSYQISIYDLFGKKQDEIIVPAGQDKVRINVASFPAGIYIAVLRDENRVVGREKFVVM